MRFQSPTSNAIHIHIWHKLKICDYSCRHTFATLYLQSPSANISELATLMGRNSEYIDTYIREINSDRTIGNASDTVYGRERHRQEETERKQILKNQKVIIEMQKQILDKLNKHM